MSVTVDQVIERYTLDDRFTAKAKKVERATDDIGRASKRAGGGLVNFSSLAKGVGGKISSAFQGIVGAVQNVLGFIMSAVGAVVSGISTVATAALGVTAAIAGFSGLALNAAADMDSLKRGLLAVAGSGAEVEKQLARLEAVAKLPGLGLREAIQGSINLQAAGFSAGLAEKALMGFGNALATVGKGKADLEGVIMALGQIASKGQVSAEEINQIAERVPQIRKIMQAAFGTANTEELQKRGISSMDFVKAIVAELGKLPKVTGGIRTAFENLQDSVFRTMSTIGTVIAERVLPVFDAISEFLEFSVKSGLIERITKGFADLFAAPSKSGVIHVLATVFATMQQLPNVIKVIGSTILTVTGQLFEAGKKFFASWQRSMKAMMDHSPLGWVIKKLVGPGLQGLDQDWGFGKAIDTAKKGFAQLQSQDIGGQIARGASTIIADFESFAAKAKEETETPKEAENKKDIKSIVKSTMETARNTREAVSLERFGIGGGDLGSLGTTPIELKKGRSGKPIDIRVTGADESLNALLSDFLRRALPLATAGRA
jgi:tape measure domain-containing protein